MYLHTAARLTGSKSTSGLALVQLVQHPGLGGDEHRSAPSSSRAAVTIPLVDRILVRVSGTTPAPTRYERAGGAAALGVDEQLGVGSSATRGLQVGTVDAGVDVALARARCACSRGPVARCTWAPRNWSGQNSTSVSSGIDATTSTAFDDVQQMSVSAFTAAVVLT